MRATTTTTAGDTSSVYASTNAADARTGQTHAHTLPPSPTDEQQQGQQQPSGQQQQPTSAQKNYQPLQLSGTNQGNCRDFNIRSCVEMPCNRVT